ncbi:helix-turn-helix domain-containing protein [Streptococcus himalayensis]|uniref:HTH cro/C1-type domain-containing protein n=1 Tax=Streptococcus himalayensis TaxID=1888195 RepID=A0A917EDK5_9STRE|nr:helix-turn-helix transcriptional regulator [Streptococcus himalayensis]GGE25368.1 hypothetical protein GCM10011510_03070 [Streptococcus himalayensis]
MTDIMTSIGTQIKYYRKQKGMTQQELAEQCDLSLPYINFVENGRRTVALNTLITILDVLEVSLGDFFQPFASTTDTQITKLLLEIQQSDNPEELIKIFLDIAKVAKSK